LIDSFPVALAKQGHRFKAKVAPELADVGYCATKKLYFYGVRAHVVARHQAGIFLVQNILEPQAQHATAHRLSTVLK